jgi:hypothetical protein
VITRTNSGSGQAARRAAKRVGLRAAKTRWRANSVDNHGGFQLIDPYSNSVVAGVRFDMSAEDVIEWCKDKPKTEIYGFQP